MWAPAKGLYIIQTLLIMRRADCPLTKYQVASLTLIRVYGGNFLGFTTIASIMIPVVWQQLWISPRTHGQKRGNACNPSNWCRTYAPKSYAPMYTLCIILLVCTNWDTYVCNVIYGRTGHNKRCVHCVMSTEPRQSLGQFCLSYALRAGLA